MKRRYAGKHYLVTYGPGFSYIVENDITGRTVWGDRINAIRFDDWTSRQAVKIIRKGGPMRTPIKNARRVKVAVWVIAKRR